MNVVLLLLLLTPAYGQKREWTDEEKAFLESVNKPIAYSTAGMENVRVLKDLAYKKTDNPNLKMDVFIPSGLLQSTMRPAVILVAGGSGKDGEYEVKNWGFYQSYGRMLAASGLVAITFTHRLGFPELAIAEGAEDLEKLIDHLRNNAGTYHIDKENIALVTFSGGGPLLSVGLTGKATYIRCLIAVYSILDVRENEFALKSVSKEAREQFSAINHIKAGAKTPPLLIVRAGQDRIPNLNKILDQFVQKAIAANLNIDFLNHPEGV
ncbi:MAG: alpha/beta hydrolase, partial [Bacteroidota bacterium]